MKPDDDRVKAIDQALRSWRQGDLALVPVWLVHIADGDTPLTEFATTEEGVHALTREVDGVVVLTQTCDIVRSCIERPFVQVAPLIDVDEAFAGEVAKGWHPRFVTIATQAKKVGDLDSVTTVEKSIAAQWVRTPGWNTDDELRWFADALARKGSRFAFPGDFTRGIARLRARIQKKHDKGSAEGAALRHLREIRVTATPDWGSERVEVFLTFVRHATPEAEQVKWDEHLKGWLELCAASGKIIRFDGRVATLEGIHGKEYVESDRMDFDYLSTS